MADFYERLQGTATRLLTKFSQGAIVYNAAGATTGDEWNPVKGIASQYPVKGTVSGVSKEYVDDATVQASDLMVSLAVFDVEPDMTGTMTIDGIDHQIIKIMQKPAAGTTVAWSLIVRA